MTKEKKTGLQFVLSIPKFLYQKTVQPIVFLFYERLIKPIFEVKDSPHSIALGVALGLWIAFTPTIGIQMIVAIAVCTIFRANILIAIAMCWITNPVTMVPCYYAYYRVGLVVTNERPLTKEEFKELILNDYTLIAAGNEKQNNQRKPLESFFYPGTVIYYSSSNPDSAIKTNEWLKKNNFVHVKLMPLKEKYPWVIEKALGEKQLAILNGNQLRRFRKKNKSYSVEIVEKIKADRIGWALFLSVLALGFTEIALYMWIGSLIIATIIAIPAYPITYKAIVRFRKLSENKKEEVPV